MKNNIQIGDLVRLRANKNLYGFVDHITDDNEFCYVMWFRDKNFRDKNSLYPYAFTSLELVSS